MEYSKEYVEKLEEWTNQLAGELQVVLRPEVYGKSHDEVQAEADGMLDSYYSFDRDNRGE